MARNTIERQLTDIRRGRLQFAVASREDDADIRRLLRESLLAGAISLSFEREPDYFADTIVPFESKQTIVARDGGELVCMGSCSVRSRFINGRESRVGYLGGLRLARGHAGQVEILRAGYEFFHQLQAEAPADYYFTSIAADNHRARRVLERGLPGMPAYQFLGDLVTVLIPARKLSNSQPARVASEVDLVDWAGRLNEFNRSFQLAPVWSAEELSALSQLGLQREHFIQSGKASAAIWDQSSFKQTVVREYTPGLKRLRPWANAWASIAGGIRLPQLGAVIRNAYLSHLVTDASPEHLADLLRLAQSRAGEAALEMLTVGFAASDPRLSIVRKHFRVREYLSRIYLVHWPDCGRTAGEWEQRLLAPEVALL